MRKTRQIEIDEEMLNCYDEIIVDFDSINVTYELWFDVDAYFGVETGCVGDDWINFYTTWHQEDDSITAEYTISDGESVDWELSDRETEMFKKMMNDYCVTCYNQTLTELWEEYQEEEV